MNPASAKTSLNQVPSLHRELVQIYPDKTFFDFGAGVKGKVDEFMDVHCQGYFPYDPFCRSNAENFNSTINAYTCGMVVCANVLNVIEDEFMTDTLSKLAKITCHTQNRIAHISVYHKSGLPTNRIVNGHFQRNEKLLWYKPLLEKWFSHVVKSGNRLICYA